MLIKLKQSLNAHMFICETLSGIVMIVKLSQYANA